MSGTEVRVLLVSPALAEGLDAHGFTLTGVEPDLRAPLSVTRVGLGPRHGVAVTGLFEYAESPLLRFVSDGETVRRSPVLDDVWTLNLGVGVTAVRWLRIDATLPLHLASTSLDGPQGFALGDARFAALFSLLRPDPDTPAGFGLALRPWIDLPTGAEAAWLGQDGIAGGGVVAGSLDVGRLSVAVDLGLEFKPEADLANVQNADQFLLGAAVGVQVAEPLAVLLESRTAVALAENLVPGAESPSELRLFGRYVHASGAHAVLGGAVGLDDAVGAAAFRLFLGGGFGTRPAPEPPPDSDGDGLADPADGCPAEVETVNGWKDDDGCPDQLARIDARAVVGDADAPDAQVEILDESGALRSAAAGRTTLSAAQPGSRWKLVAEGRCQAGEVELSAVEGDNLVRIPMTTRRDAAVDLQVVDARGAPIPGAVASWGEGIGACAEASGPLADGRGTLPLGAGEHELFVTADGWTTWSALLSVDPGQTLPLTARLERSRVQLTETQVVILDKVYFKTGKADIDPRSFPLLDDVAATIRRARLQKLEVAGHTDDVGSDSSNQALSQARAESVRSYLVQKGVPAERLAAVGYGETRPLAPGRSSTARASNRRVEFTILQGPAPTR